LSRLSPASLSCPPRTPQPPLFPYTPLFRSPVLLGLRADRHRHAVDGTGGEDAPRLEGGRGRIDPLPQAAEVGAPALVDRVLVLQDRKSTRLNSSHVKISYAVFCLKKKKKDR